MFKIYFLLPLLVPLVFLRRNPAGRFFLWVEHMIGRLSISSWRAVTFVGIVSFLLCAGLGIGIRVAPPQTHDEFGYLLLGDTFAHGRITNPTPALWEHFETIHEIERPTYAAKYPPAQGLVLAFGELLGHPILGVWLSTALACATLCWMFLAWVPPRWALVGGLLCAFHPQVLAWSQGYWGGAVALGGGALVLGAFRRILRGPRVRDSVWLGLGMAILANSRPYEGFVLSLLILMAMVLWFIQERIFKENAALPVSILFRRVFLPLAGIFVLLACQIGFYNWRVTGNPLVMPYVVHEETYGLAPLFLFGTPHPEPVYLHREIKALQESYLAYYQSQRRSFRSIVSATADKFWSLAQGYLWSFLLVVPLLALPWALMRDRWLWFVLFIGLFFLLATLLGTFVFPHYAAPASGLLFVLVLESMRHLHAWHIGSRRCGRNLMRGLALLFALSFFQVAYNLHRADLTRWDYRRQAILESLERQPGKNLVIVRYGSEHNPHREWVYNDADMAGAKVLWARDMGAEQNRELIGVYSGRKVWLIEPDTPDPQLRPYPAAG